MHVILFEDAYVSQLTPAVTAKPSFMLTVGTYRLLDLIKKLDCSIEVITRPHLKEVLAMAEPNLWKEGEPRQGPILILNARTVPHVKILDEIKRIVNAEQEGICRAGKSVACAYLANDVLPPKAIGSSQLLGIVDDLHLNPMETSMQLMDYTHDLIRYQMKIFNENIERRIKDGNYTEIQDGVFVGENVKIGQYLVTDTSRGPIVLESNSTVGPFCYLHGPVYVGEKSRVIEYAMLKEFVTVGRTCKIGGEVEVSIVEDFTNKQHHGFLGHSYLGSWINLGAGTCNSDLKNTYGEVSVENHGQKVRTGMQFIGCVIGDYSKTAINTSIFTGKTIGVCSMVYGFVTTNVPSFVNYARSFDQVTEAPVDIMIQTQARVFSRRNVQQHQCDIQLIRDMYELTRHERQLANAPLSL